MSCDSWLFCPKTWVIMARRHPRLLYRSPTAMPLLWTPAQEKNSLLFEDRHARMAPEVPTLTRRNVSRRNWGCLDVAGRLWCVPSPGRHQTLTEWFAQRRTAPPPVDHQFYEDVDVQSRTLAKMTPLIHVCNSRSFCGLAENCFYRKKIENHFIQEN